jgi:hypothetical protein
LLIITKEASRDLLKHESRRDGIIVAVKPGYKKINPEGVKLL